MTELYPIKFKPITQYRIWGGNQLNEVVDKDSQIDKLGEIWSISGIPDHLSVVENENLQGKTLVELIEQFQDKLVGKKVWEQFKTNFPLLIKFIDAQEPLSVQVHPNDKLAKIRHDAFGKTEMWYIIDAQPNAELIIGFEPNTNQEKYLHHLENETLEKILHSVKINKGDTIYIPSGRVHAIGAGVILAEIQQTSDITYRIYDYNRIDKDGKKRELHTELALDAIDFEPIKQIKTAYQTQQNQLENLVQSPYFETKILKLDQNISFQNNHEMKIYICTEGNITLKTSNHEVHLQKYESLLLPASIESYEISTQENSTLIEVKVP